MDTNDGGLIHNPGSAKRVRELLSQLQKVILSSVVTDDVQCLEDAIKVYDEYKSLFDVSNDRTSLGLLNFFPEQIAVKVRKEYHCHTPLMIACEKDNEAIIEKLLDNGASVAQKNKYGLTAAHIVCNQGNLSIFRKILSVAEKQKIFCSTKSSVGRVFSSDREVVLMTRAKKGWYPVMFAVKKGNVELLKECFQDEHLSVTSKKKKTVLHIAARAAHLNCLEELMPRVTDDIKKATDEKGWNVIHHACASGSLEVLQWLVENIRSLDSNMLNQKSKCYYTPLLTACEYKKVDIVKYLLSLADVDIAVVATSELSDIETTDKSRQRGRTALHIAAAHNSAEIVGMLIEKKCPLSIQDNEGDTALHYAYERSSTEVINLLERLDVEGVSLKDIRNEEGYLPSEIKPPEVIPLEIRRRGEKAIEIYKRVLKKGSQKLPRCNLIILGEEYVGKTSLYRLLVSKGFDENQQSTRGIDDNEVDIVDERSVTMGDEWEEKPRENQEEQVIKKYIEGVTETLHKELLPEKTDKGSVVRETVLQEHELSEELKRIRKKLKMYSNEPEASVETKKNISFSQPQIQHTAEHVTKPQQPRYEKQPQPVHKVPQIEKHVQPSTYHKKENKELTRAQNLRQRDEEDSLNSLTPSEKSKSVTAPKPPHKKSAPKKEVKSPNISRQESERISKRLKDKKKQHKREAQEPPKLELKALDFAGQKQYRPMHHCFITRRAMYLVVFNLQKMIEYIEAKELSSLPNPIEQIRYWLYSIHAHVFPPEDNIRRVCLVGTHKSPKEERWIKDEEIEKINEMLTSEFGSDDRCANLFHYMGPSGQMIFTAVENSIDGKSEDDRERSGATCLQKELKVVSKQLTFLEDRHPLIWLKFEQKLIKMREGLIQKHLPLFVTVEEVKKVAESQGIDDDKGHELALNFFHDTGKIVSLKRVPTLYLNDDERNELSELIILDPAWLSKVMRVVVELNPKKYTGDRKTAFRLVKEGIASKSLLMELWKEFLPETVNEEQSFHHLCTTLKAYCLIYPLNDNTVSNSEDRKEELPSYSESAKAKLVTPDGAVLTSIDGKGELPLSSQSLNTELPTPEKQTQSSNDSFLVPCVLPEEIKGRKDENHSNWVTFFFDFEKFLPEVIFHRFICQLIAVFQQNTSSRRQSPLQFSKTWCRFNNIHDCNWKIELLRDLHRLKISVLPSEMDNLGQYIVYIHEKYLSKICEKSELQGLKYHGGPIAKCNCLEERVLYCVSFSMEEEAGSVAASDTLTGSKWIIKCVECQTKQNVDQLLQEQLPVEKRSVVVHRAERVQCTSVSSSTDADCGKVSKDELLLLKYKNENHDTVRVRIISSAQHKWRDIAGLICQDSNIVPTLEEKYESDPKDCCQQVFVEYFINNKPKRYSHNWSGLIELLKDVELEALADAVKKAVTVLYIHGCTNGSDIIDAQVPEVEPDPKSTAHDDNINEGDTKVTTEITEDDILAGLNGVQVCGKTHVTVTNVAQSFEWKGYGMKLNFKENSLPIGTDQITIYIKASIVGHYNPPESYQQVSPIFWFLCEPICKLEKEVIFEMQHCGKPDNNSDLTFARADCSQKDLPYTFKLLNGGQFSSKGPYGTLQLRSFSGIGIFLKRLVGGNKLSRLYFACLYYPISSDASSREIHVVVTWNTPTHVTEMEVRYPKQHAKQGPHNRFQFESDRITLNVPQGSLNGWEIIPLNATVLMKDEVDGFTPGRAIPCCQLLARIVDPTTKEPLLCTITLTGAKSPNNVFTIYLTKPSAEPTSLPLSHIVESDHSDIYRKLELHAFKWRDIGRALGFLEGELENIQSNALLLTQSPPKSWLREMLRQWSQWAPRDSRGSSDFATRESLCSALLNVNLGQLAQQFS